MRKKSALFLCLLFFSISLISAISYQEGPTSSALSPGDEARLEEDEYVSELANLQEEIEEHHDHSSSETYTGDSRGVFSDEPPVPHISQCQSFG